LRYLDQGHARGEGGTLVAEVARRLRAAAGAEALIGRFSSEEFTIAWQGPAEARVRELVTRLEVAFSTPVALEDHELYLDCRVGVALAAPHTEVAELIARAAAAMEQARAQARGGRRDWTRPLSIRAVDLVGRESELRRAIDFGELALRYQPVLDPQDGRVHSVEALVRWQHPTRGLLPAGEFVPIAERSGLIGALGQRVVELAGAQAARWSSSMPGLSVAVNVSVLELAAPGYVKGLLSILERAGTPTTAVTLEVGSSALVQRLATVAPVLARLREHGLSTSVQGVGIGHSVLAHLGELPVSALKLAPRLVAGLDSDPGLGAVIAAIVAVAHARGLLVTATGIEDPDELTRVRELGVDLVQGFHLGVPQEAALIERALRAGFPWGCPDPATVLLAGDRSP
ncbi:MAG TPA: GGDEF domain-containing phosphodiesterase, partial [Solirubrobacteraceae bacterium]|nr:GGDEF domain-containing phosphodiesterase [Solirubrobacteraceae bacterium]